MSGADPAALGVFAIRATRNAHEQYARVLAAIPTAADVLLGRVARYATAIDFGAIDRAIEGAEALVAAVGEDGTVDFEQQPHRAGAILAEAREAAALCEPFRKHATEARKKGWTA